MIFEKRFSFRRFGSDRSGSPALEFALVSPLFFAAVFGTFELGRGMYERNRFSAAAAIATREIALDPEVTETAIKRAISDKLTGYKVGDLTINVGAPQTIAGQKFTKIDVGYNFKFLVNLGHRFSGVKLKTTRYAPTMTTPAQDADAEQA